VVVNVETLLNIARALDDGRPVTHKYVSVVGAVKNPATYLAPLGVRYAELLEAAGGATAPEPALLSGGPMMGHVVTDPDAVVTKTTKGLIALNADHPWVLAKSRGIPAMMRLSRTACCHCMLCTDLCPRHLLGHGLHPDKLMRLASYHSTCEKDAAATGAFLCCECGLCELACVMGLQPWKLNRELTKRLGALGVKNPHHHAPAQPNRFRPYRQYPIPKLLRRVGLAAYDHQRAPLADYPAPVTEVRLMLRQHLGAPCVPAVAVGDGVRLGQVVAAPAEGALGADIHASLDGCVKAVDQTSIVIGPGGSA
jgi:Na+-translocating ferredoxin:NAD+ oxidoreductase RnfC subunit